MNPADLLMTRPCTVVHVELGEPDVNGDRARITTTTDTVCELQQSTTAETRDGGLVVVTQWNLYLPADAVVTANDEVSVDGVAYTVDGQPWSVRDPLTGETSHVEAKLREVS